uniref:Endonuclease III n=1 Tax=Candidatus Methanophagaceae archaeon ANME-1 ERB6 TaxID=2759912 RepID=A0A7G9YTP9_9EURY|nr:G/T mismatches repair enzyme [Methanosarcinales archaeon ANME-1 ERB6]
MPTNIEWVMQILKERYQDKTSALIDVSTRKDPFLTLISCLLSLRTKDEVTAKASERLFALAKTPEEMLNLKKEKIEEAIYPVGFYKRKAEQILEICRVLVEKYDSRVPDELEELLKLKGVGRKTANIVITMGYNKPGIAVDTHVHRISNRLGLVETKTPYQTEFALRKTLPKRYWIVFNDFLVMHGKAVCTPVRPKCSICPITEYCKRIGVTRYR